MAVGHDDCHEQRNESVVEMGNLDGGGPVIRFSYIIGLTMYPEKEMMNIKRQYGIL